jgi:hypothetical protein
MPDASGHASTMAWFLFGAKLGHVKNVASQTDDNRTARPRRRPATSRLLTDSPPALPVGSAPNGSAFWKWELSHAVVKTMTLGLIRWPV